MPTFNDPKKNAFEKIVEKGENAVCLNIIYPDSVS